MNYLLRLLVSIVFLLFSLTLAADLVDVPNESTGFYADGGQTDNDHHNDDGHHSDNDEHHNDEENDSHNDESHHDSEDGHHDNSDDHHSREGLLTDYSADVAISLRSEIVDADTMAFVGMSGGIENIRNPTLKVKEGQIVEITLANTTLDEHDIVVVLDGKEIHSEHVVFEEDVVTIAFVAEEAGEYVYYCSVEGHREAGMEGSFIVTSN